MILRDILYNCSVWLTFFGVRNLKVGSLFVSDNSEPKITFRLFYRFFVFFCCWCNQKVDSLFVSDNSEPKIIFRFFFQFFVFFVVGVIKNLAHYSFQTNLSQK